MIKCRVDCAKSCADCDRPHRFVLRYGLYKWHSQVAPASLAVMHSPFAKSFSEESKPDVDVFNWPFAAAAMWINMLCRLSGGRMCNG